MTLTSKQLTKEVLEAGDFGRPAAEGMYAFYAEGGIVTREAFKRVTKVMYDDMMGKGRHDGSGRFRPSMLGKCPRMQLLSYAGVHRDYHSDPEGGHLMGSGTWGHYRWQLAGLSTGFLSDIEVKVGSSKYRIAGSLDGVMSDEWGSVFELKTVNARRFEIVASTMQPFEDHLVQAAGYMEATGREVTSLVYESRDNSDFIELRIPNNDQVQLTLQMEVGSLVPHVKDRTLPTMLDDCVEKKGWTYHNCPYRVTCPLLGSQLPM